MPQSKSMRNLKSAELAKLITVAVVAEVVMVVEVVEVVVDKYFSATLMLPTLPMPLLAGEKGKYRGTFLEQL